MMIVGIGTDLIEIDRIDQALQGRARQRFAERVLSKAELALYEDRRVRAAEFVAGRFAAKEAVAKALGCGIGSRVGFRDIAVLPGEGGRPICRLSESAWFRLGLDEAVHRIHVSITHSGTLAAAYAIVEQV